MTAVSIAVLGDGRILVCILRLGPNRKKIASPNHLGELVPWYLLSESIYI